MFFRFLRRIEYKHQSALTLHTVIITLVVPRRASRSVLDRGRRGHIRWGLVRCWGWGVCGCRSGGSVLLRRSIHSRRLVHHRRCCSLFYHHRRRCSLFRHCRSRRRNIYRRRRVDRVVHSHGSGCSGLSGALAIGSNKNDRQ